MVIVEVHNDNQLQDAFYVRTKVFVDEQQVPETIEKDQYEQEAYHFVGYINEQPVSAGRCRITENEAKLERICVLKEFRGQSLGKKLILHMEQSLVKRGITIVKLGAQTHAEVFYHHLGYQTISDIFLDAEMPHVMMEKIL